MNRHFASLVLACASFLVAPQPATAVVTISTVPVGNPGNANDPLTGGIYGGVGNVYRIGAYEVTNAQYAEFLNEKAKSDPLNLYHAFMDNDALRGGITRTGSSPEFSYAAKADMGNKPVNFVSWYDSIRFANWLQNGQGAGATETGAYTLLGGTPTPTSGILITRNPSATWFLPTGSEWYKSAYHQPAAQGGDADNYWLFPTASDSFPPTIATAVNVLGPTRGNIANPGVHVVNYDFGADWNSLDGNVTTVGSAGPSSESFYGTSDQGGNVFEWNETKIGSSSRGVRGGSWNSISATLQSTSLLADNPSNEYISRGFRVASLVPLVPGDATWDDLVDGADYTVWADHYLQTGQTWTSGDFNGDGVVDGGDYTIWADNYAPAGASAIATPEPSTFVLAALGIFGLIAGSRVSLPRRQRRLAVRGWGAILFALQFSSPSHAATKVWSAPPEVLGEWNVAANWSGGLPGPTDDAVIPFVIVPPLFFPSNVTYQSGADTSIRSLNIDQSYLEILHGSIEVTSILGSASTGLLVIGDMVHPAALKATGTGTTFTATGSVALQGGDLRANSGAALRMYGATAYSGRTGGVTLARADGVDGLLNPSFIELPFVTQLTAGVGGSLLIQAHNAGRVDIAGVTQPISTKVIVQAKQTGRVEIPTQGDGWNIQALDEGIVQLTGSGTYKNSTLALQNGQVDNNSSADRFGVGVGSTLSVSVEDLNEQTSDFNAKLDNHGLVEVAPFAVLNATNGYRQFADGSLAVYLTDPDLNFPAASQARLNVTVGDTDLAGNLTIGWLGTLLNHHDEFDILVASLPFIYPVEGEFDTVTGMETTSGLYLVPKYTAQGVTLVAQFGGDANGNGAVDGGDYTTWADHYLSTGEDWTTGDFSGNGVVDGGDYTIWADNYGVEPALALAVVPEPSSALLLACGIFTIALWNRKRKLQLARVVNWRQCSESLPRQFAEE